MNPFKFGTIVQGDQFYDRETETKKIIDTLTAGNNVVLFAPRRFGKTSLTFKVIELLEKRGYICIYFDFFPVFSIQSFLKLYIDAVQKQQKNLEKLVQFITSTIKHIRPKITFGQDGKPELGIDIIETPVSVQTISQILDLPDKMGLKKKIVVVFDEFQEIEKLNSYGLENLLRTKIQQQQNVSYLFLGSRTHMLNDMFNNKNRAFYNSAYHLQLPVLPEKDSIKFLKKKFADSSIEINDECAQYLIQTAGNIPYYIQMLASVVWQMAITKIKSIDNEMIDTSAFEIINNKFDYYTELFDRQSSKQKQLLLALTHSGENIFSAEYTRQYHLNTPSTTQKSVAALQDAGIIEKEGNSYFISDPFFKRFLKRIAVI
jgi:AAA+ ATPase superfamily predicted ATPase